MKVNLPKQNNRYRGPIESKKLEDSCLIMSQAIKNMTNRIDYLQNEIIRMRLHSGTLYENIYLGR